MSCRNYLYHSSPVIMLSLRFTFLDLMDFTLYMCVLMFSQSSRELLCIFLGLFWIIPSYCILCPQNSKCFSLLEFWKIADLYLSSCFLHLRLEITSRQNTLMMTGLTSSVFLFSVITFVLWLLSRVWTLLFQFYIFL